MNTQENKTIRHKGEKKFVVGRTYWDRSAICDYDTVFEFTVVSRTAKRMTILKHGKEVTKGIYEVDGVEHCKPNGTYSMCAVIKAEMYFADEPTEEPACDTAKLIRDAVEPLRSAAEDYAEEHAGSFVMKVIRWLAENDSDLNRIAPYVPYGNYHYDENQKKRTLIGAFCDYESHSLARNVPQIMLLNPTKIADYVKRERNQAGLDFDAYVEKLINKIGNATKVELITSLHNPWLGSTLKCTMTDGSVDLWETKMIINQSKLGTLFNQFPTRKLNRS